MPFIALCGALGYLWDGPRTCAWGVAISAVVVLIITIAYENHAP